MLQDSSPERLVITIIISHLTGFKRARHEVFFCFVTPGEHNFLLFRRLTQDGEILSRLAQKRSSRESKSEASVSQRSGWSDLSDASRQDLQATLKKLEGAKQNAAEAPQAVSAPEERIQQVKDAIYRFDPLHVQTSKLQTAIGRAESTVKNRREQLWQSQQALEKAQDHLCELQRRLEEVMHQRKEEENQGYDTMDLQDGFGSWWDADSPGLDDDEEHSREWSQQSWRSCGGYHPRQDWHRSQCAVEDLSVKFAEMQKYIGNITTQYSTFQTEVMLAIQALTHQQKQRASAHPVQPSQSKRPARDKTDGDVSPRKLLTVPSDVVVGADDDDSFIEQLDQPSDVQGGVAQELR